MTIVKLKKQFTRPGLHLITEDVQKRLSELIDNHSVSKNGVLYLFNPHTSCGLTLNEAWDPTARKDLESFFDHLAPENLPFVEHVLEGPDDSPAHMKSSLLSHTLTLFVQNKDLILGQWQGIYCAEFRTNPPMRSLYIKYQPDCTVCA